jgi:hypothetical protein
MTRRIAIVVLLALAVLGCSTEACRCLPRGYGDAGTDAATDAGR